MKREIRLISSYRSLMIGKYFLNLSLAFSIYQVVIHRLAISPLYILFLLNVLPPIITFCIIDYNHKHDNIKFKDFTYDRPFLLTTLKKKYNYHINLYLSNSISYLFSLVLLVLWHINYFYISKPNYWIVYLPIFIITSSLFLRIGVYWFYRLKLPQDIIQNKL